MNCIKCIVTGGEDIQLSSEERTHYMERFGIRVIAYTQLKMAETVGEGNNIHTCILVSINVYEVSLYSNLRPLITGKKDFKTYTVETTYRVFCVSWWFFYKCHMTEGIMIIIL